MFLWKLFLLGILLFTTLEGMDPAFTVKQTANLTQKQIKIIKKSWKGYEYLLNDAFLRASLSNVPMPCTFNYSVVAVLNGQLGQAVIYNKRCTAEVTIGFESLRAILEIK